MSASYGSSAFLPRSDSKEELHVETVFGSIPIVPVDVNAASRICIDDPFSIMNPEYLCMSSPGLLDPGRNQFNSSLFFQKNIPDDDDCEVPSLNSSYLVRSLNPTLPTGKRLKKTGANSGNNIHKLIERRRRNDMRTLYSTLRSLLPEENLKACYSLHLSFTGKRSLSDQLQEVVNYIYQLEKKVKELGQKREEIRISDNTKIPSDHDAHSSKLKVCEGLPYHGSEGFPKVTVEYAGRGVQITVNMFTNQIIFSNILLALEEEGLEVVAAVATTINDKICHTIHSKVSDPHRFQCGTLCEKLWQMMAGSLHDS
eukprot:Gb_26735 [translate_table: standard]